MGPGGARKSQEEPGGAKRSQVGPAQVAQDVETEEATQAEAALEAGGEATPVKKKVDPLLVVKPTSPKVQYGLERFWKKSPSKVEMMPAMEAQAVRLKESLQDGETTPLKRTGRGRPSNAEKNLEEARRQGEALVVQTLKQYEEALQNKKEEMGQLKVRLFARTGGNVSTRGQLTGVVEEGLQSNRRRPGGKTARKDESAGTKLKIAEHMKVLRQRCATDTEWKRTCVQFYSKKWKTLQKILNGEATWRARMKTLKIGFGSVGTTASKGTHNKGDRWLKKGGMGARASGAGRKDQFSHLTLQVKAFLEKERSRCHHVDKQDLVEEFIGSCQQELTLVKEKIEALSEEQPKEDDEDKPDQQKQGKSVQELVQLAFQGDVQVSNAPGFEELQTSEEHLQGMNKQELEAWEELLQNRITRLTTSEKYRQTFGGRLLEKIGGKLMQPGRMSTLSMEEEEAGVKATWKEFDAAMWLAAFGEEADLQKLVSDPGEFIHGRHNTIIGFSDQIPVWVKIGRKKQVYCGDEVKRRKNTEDFKELQKKRRADKAIMDKEAAGEDEEGKEEPEEERPGPAKEADHEKGDEEQNNEAPEEAEDNKKAEEEREEPAEEVEEKTHAEEEEEEEEDKNAAEKAEEKKEAGLGDDDEAEAAVQIQDLLVEDPFAGETEDGDLEQDVVEMETGGTRKEARGAEEAKEARKGQEEPRKSQGGARGSQEEPGGARRSPGRSHEEPGEARRSPGGARRSPEKPGGARRRHESVSSP